MKKITLGLTLFLNILLTACSEPIPADKKNYIGQWMSVDSQVTLLIEAKGQLQFSNKKPRQQLSISGAVKSFPPDSLRVSTIPFSTDLQVDQTPYQDQQGHWFMVVNGYTLAKRD